MVSLTFLASAAAGVAIVGLVLYRFDKNRRSDPEYRQKLIKKRREAKKAALAQGGSSASVFIPPPPGDVEASRLYYARHMQLGDECLNAQKYEDAAKHFAAGISVTDRPDVLLAKMSQLFPEPFYQMIINELRKLATPDEEASGIEELE